MATSRRTFLKFLSISPAIFQALPIEARSRFALKKPKDIKKDTKAFLSIPEPPRGLL